MQRSSTSIGSLYKWSYIEPGRAPRSNRVPSFGPKRNGLGTLSGSITKYFALAGFSEV
jgi:hypothetical protein